MVDFWVINRVQWTRLCYFTSIWVGQNVHINPEIEFVELGFYKLKSTPLDLISQQIALKTQTIYLKTQNFQNKQSLSFPPTLSLSQSLTLTLAHSHSSFHLALSLYLAPSSSLYQFHSVLPSRSVVVALPLRRRPKNGLLAMISIPTTAGYHSHLISSMWFLGFYIIVWMIVWIVCVLEKWVVVVGFAYLLFLLFFFFFFFGCNVNWVECLNWRLIGFWIFF